jgi:hypothetical protein
MDGSTLILILFIILLFGSIFGNYTSHTLLAFFIYRVHWLWSIYHEQGGKVSEEDIEKEQKEGSRQGRLHLLMISLS